MKLASLAGGRDGQLVVVSRDNSRMVSAASIAATLQAALDDWSATEDPLNALYQQLNSGEINGDSFSPELCDSPLPRAFQWADGSAYVNHVELVRKARGAELPESFWQDPLMYQGGSDRFLPPTADICFPRDDWGIDFEAEVAVITDDVPMGVSPQRAAGHIKLFMLVNDISLRSLIPAELAKGFGFFQSKPASAFSPLAITADELGEHWREGRAFLPLLSTLNGQLFGKPNSGVDMTFNFAQLIAHAATSRHLEAGTIIGSGTVSNRYDGGPGKPVNQGGLGYSCIAEQRSVETLNAGEPRTRFMTHGDRIRIEMNTPSGQSLFGAIDQRVVIDPQSVTTGGIRP